MDRFEDHWSAIVAEWQSAVQHATWITWPQSDLHTGGWSVIPLWLWPEPEPHQNITLFPTLARLVSTYFPTHRAVGFSRMAPHTVIHPHCGDDGPNATVRRYHLGIDCPGTAAGIRVGKQVYHWHNGGSFTFDDHYEHTAWNHSDQDRIILIIDHIPEHK